MYAFDVSVKTSKLDIPGVQGTYIKIAGNLLASV